MTPLTDRTIYFDGGASPNPGPITVAVVHGDTSLLRRLDRVRGGNNEAEFRAAAAALDHAMSLGLRRPMLAGDSDAVISTLGSGRPPKPGRLTCLYEECAAKAEALGGVVWRQVARTNPAGRLIQAYRRTEKSARRHARRSAGGPG